MDFDEMAENVQDRQPSNGSLRIRKDFPFTQFYLDVRDERGYFIGTLMIEELDPIVKTDIKDRIYRSSLSFDQSKPSVDELFNQPFDDE